MVAGLWSGAAAAQAADEEEPIVVIGSRYVPATSITASKNDAPLVETPQSVSVITRDQIDLLGFVDVQQAVRYTAGVVGETFGPDLRFDFLSVRGFTPKQYIDGLQAPISTAIYSVGVDLYAFEEVDILKGPSSVLYGNAPPGGIYNLVSRRADSTFGGEIGVRAGEQDFAQVQATMTGPVADGLAVRFTGLYRDRGSQVDFVDAERVTVAPTATWRIGPDTELTGLAYYQHDVVTGDTNGFLPVEGVLLPNPNGKVRRGTNLGEPSYNRYERRQFGAGYDFSHRFGSDVRIRSNAKWSEYDEDTALVYATGLDPADLRTVSRSLFPYRERVASFAADNRVEARVATGPIEHSLLAGVDYRNVSNDADFGFAFGAGGTIDLFDPAYDRAPIETPPLAFSFNDQRVKQAGVYVQDQARIGGLVLTLGGRQDWVEIRNRATGETEKQDKFTYRVSTNYVTASGLAPYLSYSTAFEPVIGTDAATGTTFEPSTARQIEAGVKYDGRTLSDRVRVFATAALFRIDQKNLVTVQPSVTPVFGVQTGAVRVEGAEIEAVARLYDRLSVNGSYSYTESEVREGDDGSLGAELPTTPRHKASLFVDYGWRDGALAGLGLGFGGRYVSRSAGSLPGPFNPVVYYGEASTLFDAIARYELGDWRLQVNASNLFDRRYAARCSGPVGCSFGQRRQVIATASMRF